jgi:HPt (histidine-containing phosphotransfer) domain-containing protein
LQVLANLKDSAFLQDVFPLFEIQSEKSMRLLAQAAAAKDLKEVSNLLHAYKGSSGSMGAQALHETIRHAYEATRLSHWPHDLEWLQRLQTLSEQTLLALRDYVQDGLQVPALDPAQVHAEFEATRERVAQAVTAAHAEQQAAQQARELLASVSGQGQTKLPWRETPLLKVTRLEELRSVGMLQDLPEDLARINSLMQKVRAGVQAHDFDEMHQGLHSLAGVCGSIGWAALFAYIGHIYPSAKDKNWPSEDNWLETIEQLIAQSTQTLRSQGYLA